MKDRKTISMAIEATLTDGNDSTRLSGILEKTSRHSRHSNGTGDEAENSFSGHSSMMGDEDLMSLQSGSTNKDGTHCSEDKEVVLARKETSAVNGLRIAVMIVLTTVAIAVSVTAFFFVRGNETQDFETGFEDQVTRVIDAFQTNAKRRVGAIESFAISITSHAKFTNSTWPFVTLPDFERRGVATIELAEVMSMVMVPFVTDDTREAWEEYSVANQEWFQEGLDVRFNADKNRDLFGTIAIPEEIYAVKGLSAARERGPGPYLPQWQIAPIVNVPALVNFNLLSHTGYQDSLNAVLEAKVAVVGKSFDFSDPNDEATAGRKDIFALFLQKWEEDDTFENDPIADLHVPLYDDYDQDTRTLVGLLTCVVYWRSYFVDILPENTNGIIVVLENTCDQKYTYQINGPNVAYVGPGDRHEPEYNSFERATDFGAYLQSDDDQKRNIDGSCLYRILVYPSKDFESTFITNKPAVYTAVLVFVFLFTSIVFFLYDCFVERRQRVVMNTAVASSAIVSSLFPKVVRDRLYKGGSKTDLVEGGEKSNPLKNPMAAILRDKQITDGPPQKSKPIADLFQDCTVLFADISGFTAWSSDREPSDVFVLLETLYGAFDKIAKKRRVFKVETIGDCYLAVTGLPEPQDDHAIIMCLFSHECMKQMKVVMNTELKDQLGGDTSVLSMRFGLHSGPVTAGVLRGEKSRFQLFGDTVNTAARMESTGKRDKIQLSEATGDILVKAGKQAWIEERKDLVEAKGKGTLQTYWLRIKTNRGNRRTSNDSKVSEYYDNRSMRTTQIPTGQASSINSAGEVSIINEGELNDPLTLPVVRYPFPSSGSSMEGSNDGDSDSDSQADEEKRDTANRSTGATERSDSESTHGQEAQDGIEIQASAATTESSNNGISTSTTP